MPINILMPALSPTMTEGNLAKWLKKEGDKIKAGEVIAEIETDKATMEVEAVEEGILGKILINSGTDNIKVGSIIAVILEEGEENINLDNYQSDSSASSAQTKAENVSVHFECSVKSESKIEPVNNQGNRIFASPLAKKIAKLENIDITAVKGTGPSGRIIKQDVLSHQSGHTENNHTISASLQRQSDGSFNVISLSNMRRTIAKRLQESKQQIPHFYLSVECNLDKLLAIRKEINESNEGLKISVNDFIIKACALALKAAPEVNASWQGDVIHMYNNIDISVAVAIDGGLITPIVKNADMKNLSQISQEVKELASRAKENKLAPHEYQGGGFTISNMGMYGIKNFKAIINPPQSAILAIGVGSERPIVEGGAIKIANIMDVTLSADHRIVDGSVGAKFISEFKKLVENPLNIFI